MKCSEAQKLILTHGLAEEQIGGLQAHARECDKCATEIESMLVAVRLEGLPVEEPTRTFADDVMAKVETIPAPGRLTTEQLLAPIAFAATVLGLAALFSIVRKEFFDTLSVQVPFNISAAAVKGALLQAVGVAQTLGAHAEEFGEIVYGNATVNMLIAVVAACGLMVLLYTAKPKRETALAGSERGRS